MHFGATLRLMRLESGLGLRELAGRLGVSSAYLSRVENGLDAAPTPARLAAMAKELRVPPTLLMGLASRVSPLVMDYVEQRPEAGALFLEIAHRELTAAQLARVHAFIDAEFSAKPGSHAPQISLGELVTASRCVVGLECSSLTDALDVAASRLGDFMPGGASVVARALRTREEEAPGAIGGGVTVGSAVAPGAKLAAAVVTLARGLRAQTPDGEPVDVVVAFTGPRNSTERKMTFAQVAQLASRGLARELKRARSSQQLLTRLVQLEALR